MQKKITVVIVVLIIIVAAVVLILQRREGIRNLASVIQIGNEIENNSAEFEESSDIKNFLLDLDDNDSTIHMRVGDELLIQLGPHDWALLLDPAAIIEPIANMPPIAGVQGIYKATQKGKVEITAKAEEVSFKATVIVE